MSVIEIDGFDELLVRDKPAEAALQKVLLKECEYFIDPQPYPLDNVSNLLNCQHFLELGVLEISEQSLLVIFLSYELIPIELAESIFYMKDGPDKFGTSFEIQFL